MMSRRTLTLEHRQAIGRALRGHTHSEETRKKVSDAKRGIPKTEEHKQKISRALLGRKNPAHSLRMRGRKQSEETRRKRSLTLKSMGAGLWNRGRKLSEEHKRKISKKLKGQSLGRKFTAEHKKKLSEKRRILLTDPTKHPQWRGGITTRERKLYLNGRRRALRLHAKGTHTQEEWEALKQLYEYRCLGCEKKEPEISLTQDHVIPLTKGGNDDITNLQPLCLTCNIKKHTKTINYLAVK